MSTKSELKRKRKIVPKSDSSEESSEDGQASSSESSDSEEEVAVKRARKQKRKHKHNVDRPQGSDEEVRKHRRRHRHMRKEDSEEQESAPRHEHAQRKCRRKKELAYYEDVSKIAIKQEPADETEFFQRSRKRHKSPSSRSSHRHRAMDERPDRHKRPDHDHHRRPDQDVHERPDRRKHAEEWPQHRSRNREPGGHGEEDGAHRNGKVRRETRERAVADGRADGDYEWGKQAVKKEGAGKSAPAAEKEKPNFGLSGKLAEETNTFKGVVLKYSEPPEARKPRKRWRLYPFKGEKSLPTLYVHRQSAYLIGRDRKIADLPVDHPSCSKQHAVFQYRLLPYTREDGTTGRRIRPYIIDLESANGTFLNNNRIESRKYVEVLERDVIKFGFSSREYVLLHEHSKDDLADEDVQEGPAPDQEAPP